MSRGTGPKLSLVVPAFNESGNIRPFYAAVIPILEGLLITFNIIFVDDGSEDNTFLEISDLAREDNRVRGIALSRNFGHQIAVCAGLEHADGEAVVAMDADLQQPPAILAELYKKFLEGYEVVVAVHKDYGTASWQKRCSSKLFYFLLNQLSDVRVPPSGDFFLLSRKAATHFGRFSERTRFNRGLVQWMGLPQATVEYAVQPRFSGASKYTLKKMCKLAFDGIFSFSSRPLRMFLYSGVTLVGISSCYAFYAVIVYFQDKTVPGWTSLLLCVLFLGGCQLIGIGVLGEYIGRIFHEVKARPLYLVLRDTVEDPKVVS